LFPKSRFLVHDLEIYGTRKLVISYFGKSSIAFKGF